MEDYEIVELYWNRNPRAIECTQVKYGKFLEKIAFNILSNVSDSEECVNDTYHKTWNTIPPVKPDFFQSYIGKIARNLAIGVYRMQHASKRRMDLQVAFEELEECVPGTTLVEDILEQKYLGECINRWLHTLKEEDMALFVRRYWNGDSVADIAMNWGVRGNKLSVRLCRLRQELKAYLNKEGFVI